MAWPCDRCGRLGDETLAICTSCGAARTEVKSPGVPGYQAPMGQRDLRMEAHLRALALWYRIGAILIGVLCAVMIVAVVGWARGAEVGVVVSISVFLLVVAGLVWLLGRFLGKYSNGARITAGVLSILGTIGNLLSACGGLMESSHRRYGHGGFATTAAFGALLSLAMSAATLWALFNNRSADICSEQYRELVARTPEQKPATFSSPFFYMPFVLIGLSLAQLFLGLLMGSRRY